MSTESKVPENDPNLSGIGRALLGTNEGSKPSGPWVPPTAEELHAILPQYEIVKMLGRGGMGAVYMGRQTALDRPVAIKILSAQLEESDMGFTERFKNEARAMGKLNHPSIVSVYEFGQHESGLLYIVMEYVDGTDVAKMIAKSGRLHTEHAMAITAHVCDALAYAHERGIIHRDIKPANIMVDYDGSVKVADFGLAKVSTSNGSTLGLTQSGMAMGTLHFMAPEALMLGTAVDHRADIYAVGVMLYQMLTGKLPQGMFKLPSLQIPGLDPRYDRIIAKAMMEDRETRYQSAREMRADLDGILTQPVVKADPEAPKAPQAALPTAARPQRPGGKPSQPIGSAPPAAQPFKKGFPLGLVVTLLLLAGAAWFLFFKPQEPKTPVVAAEPSQPATTTQASAPQSLAQIRLVTPDAVRVQKLEKGQPRLYDSNPLRVIEGVASGLNNWQFTSIPQRIDNDYTIHVEKPGTIYAFGAFHKDATPQDSLGSDASRWVDAEGDITGAMVKFCYKRNVSAGEILKFKAFELQFAAPGINLEITPASADAPVATSTSAPAATEGWTSLFNGKDLSGWELHPSNFPADVQAGAIRIRGSSTIPVSGNMYYRGTGGTLPQWTDFEVICTVKTENKGNSGIFLHTSPGAPDKNRANGIEVQVWNDTSKGTIGLTGSLQRVASTSTARIHDGEWFQIKTRVEGRRVQTWLKKTDESEWMPAVDWTQPAQWQPPGDRPGIKLGSGTISLQNNPPLEGVVWFKEIQFRLLNESGVKTPTIAPPPDVKHLLGRWTRTNMDRPGEAYLMDLSADGSALWIGDNTTVRGTWLIKAGVLEVDWNSRFKFAITLPASTSRAILKGTANWPDGKSTEIVYERQATSPGEPASLGETFNGHRYQFVPGALTWKEAKAKAESMGGHLATITTKEENEWLLLTYRKLLTTQNRNIWLGAIEEMAGLGWKWVTGESFTPLGWFPGEPNGKQGGGGQVGHPFMLNLYSFKDGAVGWNDSSTHFSQSRDNIGFIVEWDSNAPAATTSVPIGSAPTWTDTKGRSLLAKFVRLEGESVLLEVAGKETPVLLSTLSEASRQQARELAATQSVTTPVGSQWLEGRWLQGDPQKPAETRYFIDYLSPNIVMIMGGGVSGIGSWRVDGETVFIQWGRGSTTVHQLVPSGNLRQLKGKLHRATGSAFTLHEAKLFDQEQGVTPTAADLEGKIFDFGWFSEADPSQSDLRPAAALHFLPEGRFNGKTNANETRWEIKDGKLMFFHANGSRTTTFQQFYRLGDAWTLIGPFHGKPGITHVIRERVPVPDRAISASSNWSSLFPGDSLSGWTGDTAAYRVSGGVLTGSGRGDLISPKEYGNFELKFDLRISAEANSGIGIWRDAVTGTTAGASHGFEVQIQDDTAAKYSRQEFWQRHAGIFYFKAPLSLAMNPPGSWNTHEIRMEGTQVKVTINGKLVQDADVTQLKPQTGRAPVLDVSRRQGHLIIMGRVGTAEFRNMQIKELP